MNQVWSRIRGTFRIQRIRNRVLLAMITVSIPSLIILGIFIAASLLVDAGNDARDQSCVGEWPHAIMDEHDIGRVRCDFL